MRVTRYPFNVTLLVTLFIGFLCLLPIGEHSLSLANSPKSAEELDTLIDSIQKNLSMLQKAADAARTDTETNEKNLSSQEDAPNQSTRDIQDIKAKIILFEETVGEINSAIASLEENKNQQQNKTLQINETLKTVDHNIKRILGLIEKKQLSITNNTKLNKAAREQLDKIDRNVRRNSSDTNEQKSLIEDNSTRIYEVLIKLVKAQQDIENIQNRIFISVAEENKQQQASQEFALQLDKLWNILNIILIFFIPLAFSQAYTGKDKLIDGVSIGDGMVLTIFGAFFGYLVIGFGLMYGTSFSGLVGYSSPFFEMIWYDEAPSIQARMSEFLLFQAGTIILACLIIYSAVGTQLSSVDHLILAVIAGAIVVPIFGHWTFSDRFFDTNTGWLQASGFKDEAGTTAFNLTAAFFALSILYHLRKIEPNTFTSADISVYSSTTIVLLFIGWIGFTTGHLSIGDDNIVLIIMNIAVAAIASSIISLIQRLMFSDEKNRITYALGGFVSGLVAIAACAETVTMTEAIVIGAIAGSVHNIGFSFLRKSLFKQPWQNRGVHLVAIHGISSIWGIMSVALFGTEGIFGMPNIPQLFTQLKGIGIAIIYAVIAGSIAALFIDEPPEKPEES